MSEFIFFMIGAMLGGCFGVVLMCLLQINRLHNEIHYRKDNDNEDKKHSEDSQI